MMTAETNPHDELKQIIDSLKLDLIDYEKNPKKIQYVVDKRQVLITKLVNILSAMEYYNTDAIIFTIADKINKIKIIDPELDSIMIKIDYKPEATKTGYLHIGSHK